METHRQHRRPALMRHVLARGAGVWVVTAVLFATFVNSEKADAGPLASGPWLTAVALSGIFCAAWVARDTAVYAPQRLFVVWAGALVVVVLALTVAALATNTERSRAEGADLSSAFTTSFLVGAGLAIAVGIGWLCGRAVATSTNRAPAED